MFTRFSRRMVVPLVRSHYVTSTIRHHSFGGTAAQSESLSDNLQGIGQPFPDTVATILTKSLDEELVMITKDGTLHLPEEYYKEKLNEAFGIGGWALVPNGEVKDLDLTEEGQERQYVCLIREYSLCCHGRFVSQAFGETSFYPGKQSYSESTEKIKAVALARCCKDVGIASELWNKEWIEAWKDKHATQEWVENVNNKKRSLLWKHKDADWSWPYQKITGNASYQKKY